MKYGAVLQNGVRPQPDEQLNLKLVLGPHRSSSKQLLLIIFFSLSSDTEAWSAEGSQQVRAKEGNSRAYKNSKGY